MSIDAKALRWTCPHCRGPAMNLASAERHLRRRHHDCDSCGAECMLITSMLNGIGETWVSPMRLSPFPRRA
jgi:hypothetical protein